MPYITDKILKQGNISESTLKTDDRCSSDHK